MNRQTLLGRHDTDVGAGEFDSIAWVLTTHCGIHDTGLYQAAVLFGSEDAPTRVDLFLSSQPLVTDQPAFTWYPDETSEDELIRRFYEHRKAEAMKVQKELEDARSRGASKEEISRLWNKMIDAGDTGD